MGLLLAGCSGGEISSAPVPASTNVLADVDPCALLSAEELQSYGVAGPGEPVDQGIGEQGCDYFGDAFQFAIYKGEDDSLSYWEGQRDKFGVFEGNQVGSRSGIKQITKGAIGQRICNQVIEVGSGSVTVQVGYKAGRAADDEEACTKAMEIANVIEPKLPK